MSPLSDAYLFQADSLANRECFRCVYNDWLGMYPVSLGEAWLTGDEVGVYLIHIGF